MFSPLKSLLIVGFLALTPYSGGASGFAGLSADEPQAPPAQATANAVPAGDVDGHANPWALAGLLLAVMALGASRRRQG